MKDLIHDKIYWTQKERTYVKSKHHKRIFSTIRKETGHFLERKVFTHRKKKEREEEEEEELKSNEQLHINAFCQGIVKAGVGTNRNNLETMWTSNHESILPKKGKKQWWRHDVK